MASASNNPRRVDIPLNNQPKPIPGNLSGDVYDFLKKIISPQSDLFIFRTFYGVPPKIGYRRLRLV